MAKTILEQRISGSSSLYWKIRHIFKKKEKVFKRNRCHVENFYVLSPVFLETEADSLVRWHKPNDSPDNLVCRVHIERGVVEDDT